MDKNLDNKKKLIQTIARLESQLDFFETELSYLNNLLFSIGFSEGVLTLKEAAKELISKGTCVSKITHKKKPQKRDGV